MSPQNRFCSETGHIEMLSKESLANHLRGLPRAPGWC